MPEDVNLPSSSVNYDRWDRSVNEAEERISRDFWSDYRGVLAKKPPEMVYHYTDAAGLEGILTSKTIWATHVTFLNDPHEIVYGQSVFERGLARKKTNAQGNERLFLEKCGENHTKEEHFGHALAAAYCASFSARKDDLSQYRAYAGNGEGYCIGFSTEELKKNMGRVFYAGGSLFDLVQMRYDERRLQDLMQDQLGQAWTCAEGILEKHPDAEVETVIHRVSLACIRNIFQLCHYFKQEGFREEEEWRIIPTPFGAPLAMPLDPVMNVRRSGNLFVPYLEVPLADAEDRLTSLREIFAGPKQSFKKAELGLFKLLKVHDIQSSPEAYIEIKQSETSLQ